MAWLIACLWFPLTDTDIWWHLAAARRMWETRSFLRADPFCLASMGAPWTDLHWGFQLLAYSAWKLGGAWALVAGKCLAVAVALALAFAPHVRLRVLYAWIPLAAFGIYHVRFFIDVRPLALTLCGLGALYAVTTLNLRGRIRRPWLILIPVQIILVNLQGLYPLGAFLVTCLCAGEYAGRRWPAWFAREGDGVGEEVGVGVVGNAPVPLRPLAITCGALWLCGFVSPYGWDGFALPFSLFGRITPTAANIFSSEIAENLPLSDLFHRDPAGVLPFLILLGFTAATFAYAKRPSLGHALLFLAFALLGYMAQRNLPLSLLAALMAAGHNLEVHSLGRKHRGADADRDDVSEPWLGPTALLGLAAIAFLYGPRIREAWRYELPGSLETPFRFPAPAADYLEAHPLTGNIFNELRYGGYLEFRFPGKPAFIDGRMILRSADSYREFLAAVDEPARFPEYRARYAFTHAVLPIAEDQRFLPLAAYLLRESGWSVLHCDGASVVLADSSTVSAAGATALALDSLPEGHPLRNALQARFGSNPRLHAMATRNAALFLHAAGRERAAEDLGVP